jgi:hypothetical protein
MSRRERSESLLDELKILRAAQTSWTEITMRKKQTEKTPNANSPDNVFSQKGQSECKANCSNSEIGSGEKILNTN